MRVTEKTQQLSLADRWRERRIDAELPDMPGLAAGPFHTLAHDSAGAVWEWGGNAPTPALVSGLTSEVVAVAAGTIDWHDIIQIVAGAYSDGGRTGSKNAGASN